MKLFIHFILLILIASCSKDLPSPENLVKEADSADWSNAVSESIVINAPAREVWGYVSNSHNAKDWSVFFDHISPLPGITDGQIGSLRRCHRMANEDGPYWDEVVTEVQPEKFRQITTFNLNGFAFNFMAKGQYVFVRQVYRALDENQTELSFQTTPPASASILGDLGFYISRNDTRKIFKQNLENIKALIEGKPRLHPWH